MTLITRAVFAFASLLLLVLALSLVIVGLTEAVGPVLSGGDAAADAILNILGYLIVAIAVFDVAKYLFEEEVRRDAEKRSAAEARRSLTKFLSTILIALFLEGLVLVFKTAREAVEHMLYPVALIGVSVLVLVGLGVFQRLSATVEEKVGDDDEAEAAEEEGKPDPTPSRAGRARR
ncbi:GNAT family acetyltransferase [Brevundimonas sp. FT23042]|uniref:GNAT family acetyltransferase n=1 Tax=Brevundimonas sp. FT23042 TaxID=3393749 RepID=UPI003B5893EB